MDEAILVSIMGLLALSTMVTPAAIFIENRLRLGHPSKLMAVSISPVRAEVSLPPTKQVSVFTVTIARDEKTDLHVSNDGSQLAHDGSGKRGGRSLRLTRPFQRSQQFP